MLYFYVRIMYQKGKLALYDAHIYMQFSLHKGRDFSKCRN